MVPAESIVKLESRPLFLTKSVKTPSAAGLLQMLPRHTKSTEKGFVSFSVTASVVDGIEAIGTVNMVLGLWLWPRGVCEFCRDGCWFGGIGRVRNGDFRERREWRQNGKYGVVVNLQWSALILLLYFTVAVSLELVVLESGLLEWIGVVSRVVRFFQWACSEKNSGVGSRSSTLVDILNIYLDKYWVIVESTD